MLRSAWRVAAPLFVVVLLSACGSRAAAQSRCASPEGALPAGMYWTTIGWYDYELPCPPPSVAVVEGVYQNAASAQQAVRRVPSMAFEPGFPWVVEARRAGLEADGVAVV
ncbi:MAG: hypothetical protein AB8I08_30780, partial [Sandaracinaceae bacterium]